MTRNRLLTSGQAAEYLGVPYKFFQRSWCDLIPRIRTAKGWRRYYTVDLDRFRRDITEYPENPQGSEVGN